MANWNPQANDIFLKAIEIGTGDNRQAYLREACDGDDRLMGQVEALLNASQRAGSFLESPPVEVNATVDASAVVEKPGTVIGPYKLREQIGEGGMGVVYVAEQERPLRRKVALKIIKPGMDTKEVIARFEAERQALALMDHPNIARVLDAGTTESGRPYFVMELVRGISMTDYSDRYKLSTRRRLELFVKVCQAVQHAHQKGVIHRDLKPSNVLITEHDGSPIVKVIDFGVAKAINQRLTERTIYTRFQQMVGTPMYMSPEQAELSGLDVDTRSDIYSLGVLLYELLTGATPFDQQRFSEAAFDEIRRIIREEEPPKPSTKISTLGETATQVSTHRDTDPQKLRQQVRGDLDWIVMKSLEKDRTRRYATANGLAADIQRFLTEEPVQARPPSATYRLRKFVRRNKGLAVAGAALFVVLLLAVAGTTTGLVLVESARQLADTKMRETDAQRKVAEQEGKRRRRLQYDSDMVVAHHAWEQGHIERVLELLRHHVPDSGQDDLRGFEWYLLWQLCQTSRQAGVVPLPGALTTSLDYSPTTNQLAVGHEGGAFTVYNLITRTRSKTMGTHDAPNRFLTFASFSPDGRTIAHPGLVPNSVVLHDLDSGRSTTLQCQEKVKAVAFSPTEHMVAAGQVDGVVVLHDLSTGQIDELEADGNIWSLAISADGKRLAAGHGDGRIEIWSLDDRKLVQRSKDHRAAVWSVAFSRDGGHLVSGDFRGTLNLWKSNDSKPIATWQAHEAGASAVFSAEGTTIASCGWGDNTVKLWDASNQDLLRVFKGHSQPVVSVKFSADGNSLFSVAFDRKVQIWDLSRRQEPEILRLEDESRINEWIDDLAFSANGRTLAVSRASLASDGSAWSWREKVSLWHLDTGELESTSIGQCGTIQDAAFSTDWQVATVDVAGRIQFWDRPDSDTPKLVAKIPEDDTLVSISASGRLLAAAGRSGTIRLWSVNDGELLFADSEKSLRTGDVRFAFSRDERSLATGHRDGSVILWDTASGAPTIAPYKHDKTRTLAFSADGTLLASGGFDGDIRLWHFTENEKEPHVLRAHTGPVRRLVFSRNGSVLYSAGGDGTVKAWDLAYGHQRGTLETPGTPYVIAFSPDEKVLAVGTQNRPTVKLWRAASEEEVLRTNW